MRRNPPLDTEDAGKTTDWDASGATDQPMGSWRSQASSPSLSCQGSWNILMVSLGRRDAQVMELVRCLSTAMYSGINYGNP